MRRRVELLTAALTEIANGSGRSAWTLATKARAALAAGETEAEG